MVNNIYRRSFSYTMHMIQNTCNLRYKDAYTSCYICQAKCKKYTKESHTYATKELPQPTQENNPTQSSQTADSSRGGKKGLAPPAKEERKTHKLPLNTCTRAK
jgi:hypothetical protein